MRLLPGFALSFLPFIQSAVAHGSLHSVVLNGKSYTGDNPSNVQHIQTPIRVRGDADVGPVKDPRDPAILCGPKAGTASETAPADPGSKMTFAWVDGNLQPHWPHDTGPILAYMTKCEGKCEEFQPTLTTPWFKIYQAALKPGTENDWVEKDLYNNQPYSIDLPKDIAPGDYLLRIETLALHLASTQGGAEFYPSCVQLSIGGSGAGVPSPTVTFSDAYSENDPGIFIPNLDNGFKVKDYVFPGGPVASFTSGSSGKSGEDSDGGPTSTPNATSTATGSRTATSAPSGTGTGTAKRKSCATSTAAAETHDDVARRDAASPSRVMPSMWGKKPYAAHSL